MRGIRRIHTVVGFVLIFAVSACFSVEVASIHEAARLGDLDKVKAFLDQGIDINAKNERGQAAMHVAVNGKQKKITELLITKGGDVNVKDKWGYTPLYYAIWNEDANMVSLLVDKGADVNVRVNGDGTPLVYAVWNEDIDMARLFVSKGAKFDVKDDEGMTAFRYAVLQANREFVEFFVDKGADVSGIHGAACMGDLAKVKNHLEKGTDVDIKDEVGWTPLFWAACMGQEEVGEFLLSKGVQADIKIESERTPLHQAANSGAQRLVELLIANGADVNAEDQRGNTPLHSAAAAGHSKIVEFLITKSAEVTRRNRNSWTPLHLAARSGHKEVVKFLMTKGVDVTLKDRRGLTALDWSRRRGHSEVIELLISNKANIGTALISAAQDGDLQFVEQLLDHDADVNFQDSLGLTALHAAASTQDSNCVSLLLDRGAKVNVQDKAGRTPLHYAVGARQLWSNPKEGDIQAARLLLNHRSNVNTADKYGKTPLYYSVRLGKKMTELLLSNGADPNYIDPRGIRALPSKEGRTFYMAPDGDDSSFGTQEHPFRTFNRAVITARPGDTIYVRGGTHRFSHGILVEKSGQPGKTIRLEAYPDETPVFDFFGAPWAGILVKGAFWHIKGIAITNAGSEAIKFTSEMAHHNILEEVIAQSNGLTGIAIHIGAAHNLVLNCDAYRNFDYLGNGENADGFEVKFAAGKGNILIGNRAWNNADDGYDFWDMDKSVRLEHCYAWRNGENLWEHPFFTGNGNGFKLGRGTGRHLVINCVAWNHHLGGFNLNGNETGVILYGCTAMNNVINFQFNYPQNGARNTVLRNNLSYKGQFDRVSNAGNSKFNSWNDELDLGIVDDDFQRFDDSMITASRNSEGSIPQNDFLELASGSAAIDAGVDVNMPYVGKAPDLGAFEYDPNETPENYVKMLHQYVRDHNIPKIRELLAKGEDVNAKDWLGYAPLHWAVYFGYSDLVELLIEQGANPSLISGTGRSPLDIAEAMDYKQIADILNNAKANE